MTEYIGWLDEDHAPVVDMAQEVVRCRDCKWFTPEYWWQEDRGYGALETMVEPSDCGNPERCSKTYDSMSGKIVPLHIVTEPDGFCAWGERTKTE